MKRAHRRTHGLVWILMGPILAAILWLSLAVRPNAATLENEALPDALLEEAR